MIESASSDSASKTASLTFSTANSGSIFLLSVEIAQTSTFSISEELSYVLNIVIQVGFMFLIPSQKQGFMLIMKK